jgi:hypothetical protein
MPSAAQLAYFTSGAADAMSFGSLPSYSSEPVATWTSGLPLPTLSVHGQQDLCMLQFYDQQQQQQR